MGKDDCSLCVYAWEVTDVAWRDVGWRRLAMLRFHQKEVIWGYGVSMTQSHSRTWHGWWEKILVRGSFCYMMERGSDVTSSILSALTLQRSQLGTGMLCSCRLPNSPGWWSCNILPQTATKIIIKNSSIVFILFIHLSSQTLSWQRLAKMWLTPKKKTPEIPSLLAKVFTDWCSHLGREEGSEGDPKAV